MFKMFPIVTYTKLHSLQPFFKSLFILVFGYIFKYLGNLRFLTFGARMIVKICRDFVE